MTSKCSVLQVSAAWPHTTKLSIKQKMLLLWPNWSCCETVSIGKRTRGASEGAVTPQEQLKPHRISVVVAAVRPNADTRAGTSGPASQVLAGPINFINIYKKLA